MINAVLDMAQIEADHLELHPAEIELPGLVHACLDVVRAAAEAKGLALTLAQSAPLRLFADPTRLRQVLTNLLGNAVKFTPAGTVEVRLRQAGPEATVRLEVADTGPGVQATDQPELFRTFERLNVTAAGRIEGAGPGLSLAARLVRAMGGRIGYADNPGGGSVFWLELPPHAGTGSFPATAPDANVPEAEPAPARALAVLVVDDVAMNRDVAASLLRAGGHTATCVESGAQAIAAVESTDFDVVGRAHAEDGRVGSDAPPTVMTAEIGAEQLVCNPSAFHSVADLLAPGDVSVYLQAISKQAEALLRDLYQAKSMKHTGDELGRSAHKLAGCASMLGFERFAALGRRLENAIESGAADAPLLADAPSTAIEDTLAVIRAHSDEASHRFRPEPTTCSD